MRVWVLVMVSILNLCSAVSASEEMDCHAHYRKGYRIKHCTPKSELAVHLKEDPIYYVHDTGQNDYSYDTTGRDRKNRR
jgi:hypothetical protein